MNVGILLPNWIGDVAMATPALRALRKQFPRPARLVGVMRPYVADVLAGTSWLDERVFHRTTSRGQGHASLALVRQLRRRKLDAMVLLTNSLRTAAVAWLSGAKRRVGYARNGRGPLLTDALYPPRRGAGTLPCSAVDYYLGLAYYLGCPPESRRLELATLPADELAADRVWNRLGLADAGRVIALNTGGAYGGAKHWPCEHAADLARRAVDELDASVLVLCGPKERDAAAEIAARAAHPRVVSMADQPMDLGVSKACIRRAHAMVTTDSGPRHIAAAFNVPTVALFGPVDPGWSANYNPRAINLHLPLPCRPCAKRSCPLLHHRCMNDLTPDRVFGALASVAGRELQFDDVEQPYQAELAAA
jgi:heptosyltransferase-2